MRRYSQQSTTVYAVVFVLAGFALLALGWRGAAATLFIPTQVAYAVSGSIAGLGLIGAGAALLDLQAERVGAADRAHDLDRIVEEAAEVLARLSRDSRTGPER